MMQSTVRYTDVATSQYRYTPDVIIIIIINGIQPLGRSGQRPEFSQATGMALARFILGKFLGVACHCFPPLLFLDVPTFHHQVPPRPPRRERSQRRKWELWARMLSGNFAEMTTSTLHLGIFYMPQIYDMGPTVLLPLRRKAY